MQPPNFLLTLKKIVPNLVQLGDCRLERGDKEPFAITSREFKAIERLERMGNLEIKVDLEIFASQVSIRAAISPAVGVGSALWMKWYASTASLHS